MFYCVKSGSASTFGWNVRWQKTEIGGGPETIIQRQMFSQIRETFDNIRELMSMLSTSPFYKLSTEVAFQDEIASISVKSYEGGFNIRASVCNGEEFRMMISESRTYLAHNPRFGFLLCSDSKICLDGEPHYIGVKIAQFGWRISETEFYSVFKEIEELFERAVSLSANGQFYCSPWKPSFLKKTLVNTPVGLVSVDLRDRRALARILAQMVVMKHVRSISFEDLIRECPLFVTFVERVVSKVTRKNPTVPKEAVIRKLLVKYLTVNRV